VQGAVIGVIGTALGVAGGIALALNIDVVVPALERLLSTQFLSKDVYLINELPSELQRGDVIQRPGGHGCPFELDALDAGECYTAGRSSIRCSATLAHLSVSGSTSITLTRLPATRFSIAHTRCGRSMRFIVEQ